jgi:hypothetical protein
MLFLAQLQYPPRLRKFEVIRSACLLRSAGDKFGSSVAISADGAIAVVGAPWRDDGGSRTDVGSIYIFKVRPFINRSYISRGGGGG